MSRAVKELYDVLVVGLGAVGSAACYHASKQGKCVLGLEMQAASPHQMGSSHGESRIIRLAYHEHPEYIPMIREAYRLWSVLEKECGQTLFTQTGYLDISPPSSNASEGVYSLCDRSIASAQRYGLQYEVLTAAETMARYPALQLPAHYKTCYQPDGGILNPEACIAAHLDQARTHGAHLVFSMRVTSWDRDDENGVLQVTTDQGTVYRGRKLILTAGPWIGQLVPWLQSVCVPERQVVGWFAIEEPSRAHCQPSALPVFCVGDDKNCFYGFPEFGNSPGLKVGKFRHLREEYTDADDLARTITSADEQVLRDGLAKFLPCASQGAMLQACTCVFTNTPDGDFIIDTNPQHQDVVLCSACSGHGFKMSNVVGKLLVELALQEGTTSLDIEFLRLQRLRQKKLV